MTYRTLSAWLRERLSRVFWVRTVDVAMHRVRIDVPCDDCVSLLENRYERFTERTYYLWGRFPIRQVDVDVVRVPIHELIHHAIYGA